MKKGKMSWKPIVSFFMALALAAALAGCSGGGQTSAPAQSTAESVPSKVVELTFWSLFTGDDGVTMNQIVQKFNDEHPNIRVTHIAMEAMSDLYVKLPMVAGNDAQAPELAVVWNTFIPYLVAKNSIQPIDIAADNYPVLADENFVNPEMVRYNGERYGVMLDFPSVTLWGNKDLIEKYCPEILEDEVVTWEEVFSLGDTLKEQGVIDQIKPVACDWAMNDIEQNLLAAGKNYSQDGVNLSMTEQDVADAIRNWKELNDKGYFMPEGADAFGMFSQGQCVFCSGGTWSLNTVKEYGVNYIELPPIQYSADNVVTNAVAHSFVLPQRSYTDEQRNAVGTFIDWFEQNAILWAQAGSIVANKAVQGSDEFQVLPQALVSRKATFVSPNYIYVSICEDTLNNYAWQPVYGHISVDDYAKAVISKITSQVEAQQ
ncbi:extracellular solute-binding protein [Allofournierella sp.]|uniref:extracellular solute-binding protein n=1 Tax=Allofournierella sp. TaxID=1940256 RepID=UPI003AEF57E7